jgi:hypothetical protein
VGWESVFLRVDRHARDGRVIDYRSLRLRTASDCARTLRFGFRELTLRGLGQLLMQVPVLIRLLCGLPRTDIRLSDNPAGLAIAEHLSLTRWGIPRFRLAQGVLYLPADFAAYLRGHPRQALRTNIRRARDQGISCHRETIPAWTRPEQKLTCAAPVERWWATNRDGTTVGEAWLTVDEQCALLHGLGSSESYVRWLLHAAIVERLCASRCQLLLTNSHDAPLMAPGQQYFQRLLGYSVARLRQHTPATLRLLPAALLAIVAMIAIVGVQMLNSPINLAGHRAVVWLTALTAVRVAANRAGWATLTGAVAGLATVLLGALPMVSLAYFLCGVALDTELALFPRLARGTMSMSCTGVTVILVTLIAPEFPTLGHHPPGMTWPIPPALGAILFGALAAILGQRLGQAFKRSTNAAPRPLVALG